MPTRLAQLGNFPINIYFSLEFDYKIKFLIILP